MKNTNIKICRQCKKEKPIECFSIHKGFKDGRNSKCKDCKNMLAKTYYSINSNKILSRQKKFARDRLLKKYGISEEQYKIILINQNERCAICGTTKHRRELSVDHDHITGLVRGLLCDNCNWILGLSKDNPAILRKASDYLIKHGKHPNG